MFGNNKETQEFLKQLANKLAASTHQLSEAARRLQLAELTYREYLVRLRKLDQQMRGLMELLQGSGAEERTQETNPAFCEPPAKPVRKKLRYSDYIEFSNYAELKKFEKMGEITDDELKTFDADDLMRQLMTNDPA